MDLSAVLEDGSIRKVEEHLVEQWVKEGLVTSNTVVIDPKNNLKLRAGDVYPFKEPLQRFPRKATSADTSAAASSSGVNATKVLGTLIVLCGMATMYYYMFGFDISVETPRQELFGQTIGGDKTANLGLMNERVCGCIVGAASAIMGELVIIQGSIPKANK